MRRARLAAEGREHPAQPFGPVVGPEGFALERDPDNDEFVGIDQPLSPQPDTRKAAGSEKRLNYEAVALNSAPLLCLHRDSVVR